MSFHVCVFCVDAVPVMVQHTLMQSSSSGRVTLPPTSFPPTLHHTFLRQQVSYECYSLHIVLKGQFTQSTNNLLLPLVASSHADIFFGVISSVETTSIKNLIFISFYTNILLYTTILYYIILLGASENVFFFFAIWV